MPPAPVVSIAIASYNAATYLEAAVASALGQAGPPVEILIVDDGSTDGSEALGRALAQAHAEVRFERLPENGGPAAARNRAIDLARGDWLAILDSDDLMAPGRLARLVAHGEASGADIVADDLMLFTDGPPPRELGLFLGDHARPGPVSLEDYLRRTIMYGDVPDLGFLKPVLRLARMRAAGIRYDTRLRIAEDVDLVLRLLLGGLRLEIVAEPGYRYRKHDASISHRLSVPAVAAMHRASADLLPLLDRHSAEARRLYRRRHARIGHVLAFERLIAALKARQPLAALGIMIGNPGLVPMLRMPIGARLARLAGRG